MPTPRTAAPSRFLYLAVGLISAAIIALQLVVMRIFAVGSWAHFGSLVVSLAMMGFGLTSVVMCAAHGWCDRHWRGLANTALVSFGPLAIAANLIAQQVPFNAIFLVSDATQKWRLATNFVLYLVPFVSGASFLGAVFLHMKTTFGKVYFADLVGAGAGGMTLLIGLYVFRPDDLIAVPLALWLVGGVAWFAHQHSGRGLATLLGVAALSLAAHFVLPNLMSIPKLAVSDYKGVAYARKFPDNQRVYENSSPFGYLEIYSSSYLHFAPGLSDNAAFNLPTMPANAYLGMYIDGDGPIGIMRNLSATDSEYFHYLPMAYPYLLKPDAATFVVQFGGGISTMVALHNSRTVTVAEGNPAILAAFRRNAELRDFTGDILGNPKLDVIDYDGRLYLANTPKRYDVIDLSLADSAGLSNPGGFAIVEKYAYTREAMAAYMRALAPGGILAVTLWNKEEPPKSVLKLYTTMVAAARGAATVPLDKCFYAVSSYLSTVTVLYKQGGFNDDEIAKLHAHSKAMSFDEIAAPGLPFDATQIEPTLVNYRASIFGAPTPLAADLNPEPQVDPTGPVGADSAQLSGSLVPATTMGQIVWNALLHGDQKTTAWDDVARRYVFDIRPLTNDRPYFAAYIKPVDLPRITDRLELFQDEWGYLLLFATLGIAVTVATVLIAFPVVLGWRSIFNRYPGRLGTIIYFACLGLGYIMVEVSLIAKFVLPLGNPTVSATILITGMLVFSGLGSLVSGRYLDHARALMPKIFIAISALLFAYGAVLDPVLGWIGSLAYASRIACSFALIAPPAFLMGFPMATAMTWLGRLGKDPMFLWAWGINGSFSVIGAAAVPIIATAYGLAAVLQLSGVAYLIAALTFFAIFAAPKNPLVAVSD